MASPEHVVVALDATTRASPYPGRWHMGLALTVVGVGLTWVWAAGAVPDARQLWTPAPRLTSRLTPSTFSVTPGPWGQQVHAPQQPPRARPLRAAGGPPPAPEPKNPFQKMMSGLKDLASALQEGPIKWPYSVPMTSLHLDREEFIGGDYEIIPICIGDSKPLNFILDSTLTGSVITPAAVKELGLQPLKVWWRVSQRITGPTLSDAGIC